MHHFDLSPINYASLLTGPMDPLALLLEEDCAEQKLGFPEVPSLAGEHVPVSGVVKLETKVSSFASMALGVDVS